MTRLVTIAPLFLLSGGTALLYQVAFSKRLATIFGATAYAISAVLAAFMAGLLFHGSPSFMPTQASPKHHGHEPRKV